MKTLVSAVMLSMTMMGAAYAGEPSGELDYPPVQNTASNVTRAQIQAELQAAKAAGQVTFGEQEQPAAHAAGPVPSRAAVRAETQAAHDNGADAFGELDYQASYSLADASRG
ncbi:DUF4148 domain-containing protein [Bordetella sp. BOR01]|uniref:DUF4148 domain-containing protein n=1 Tax=Bordetella sp. BOR01 TaxID=2854779 RepID=UPI001C489047|nr:DUF4148 domain-containing protein [Bordetella sp. BOR01]MBV7484000.1 DUF4148 domain-containing protein [Bordetella sp. BOR01]